MRRLLPACLVALALTVSVAPVHAQSTILDRKPMDVGADQVGAIRQLSQDMLYPYRYPKLWFDAGIAYPVGNLQDRNIDPGLMLRFNQTFWYSGSLSAYGSVGAMFGNDSYFNDAQNAIAAAAPISTDPNNTYSGVDIQSRYFWMVPATVNGQFALKLDDGMDLSIAAGPGVVWTHESYITSAVNNGVGSADGRHRRRDRSARDRSRRRAGNLALRDPLLVQVQPGLGRARRRRLPRRQGRPPDVDAPHGLGHDVLHAHRPEHEHGIRPVVRPLGSARHAPRTPGEASRQHAETASGTATRPRRAISGAFVRSGRRTGRAAMECHGMTRLGIEPRTPCLKGRCSDQLS